jgi:hypothetical protein
MPSQDQILRANAILADQPGEADAASLADVQARWHDLAALHNKTPAGINTMMQGAIDGWTSLAQAKADFRVWLPALVAALGWTVLREQQRD